LLLRRTRTPLTALLSGVSADLHKLRHRQITAAEYIRRLCAHMDVRLDDPRRDPR
jgi:hypothetical protein